MLAPRAPPFSTLLLPLLTIFPLLLISIVSSSICFLLLLLPAVPTSSPLRLPPENKVGGRSHAQLWKTVVGIDTPRQMRRALEFLKKYPEFVDEDKIQSRLREGEARMGSRGLSYRLLCRENPEILSWADEELGARLDRLSILLPNHPTPRLLHCYPRAFAYAHLSKRKFLTRLFSDRMSLCIQRMTGSFDFDAVAMLPGGDGIKDEEHENAGSEGAMIMRGRRLLDKMKRAEQSAEDLAELEALWGYTRLKFSKRAFRAFEALSFGGNGLQIGNLYDDFSSSAAPLRIASVGGGPGSDVAGAIFWHEIVYGSRGNVKARIFDVSDTWCAISQVAADALETNVEFGHCDVSDTLFSSSANEAFLAFVRSEARMGHPWLFIFSFVLFEAGHGSQRFVYDLWDIIPKSSAFLLLDVPAAGPLSDFASYVSNATGNHVSYMKKLSRGYIIIK